MQKSNKKNKQTKKSVLVVTGTRAEYGHLRSTMDAVVAHPKLVLRLLVTGSHTLRAYGYTKREIVRDGYAIDCTVPVPAHADMLSALAVEIEGIKKYCLKRRPDCVLVLGDRDEAFAGAVVAAHLNIPLVHIHGGDVSGPGVDEALRHAISKMAHLHFPGTQKSARRLRAMGEEPWRIVEAGSVTLDILKYTPLMRRAALAGELGLDLKRPWLTVLQHPTAFDTTPLARQLAPTLVALKKFPEHEKILIYPNTDTGSAQFVRALKAQKGPRYHLYQSLPRPVFMSVLKESEALVGNSSAGVIELSALGTPGVDIGNRQAGRERAASVISVPYNARAIAAAMVRAQALKRRHKGRPLPTPYGGGDAGKKIAAQLARLLYHPRLLTKRAPLE